MKQVLEYGIHPFLTFFVSKRLVLMMYNIKYKNTHCNLPLWTNRNRCINGFSGKNATYKIFFA